MSLTSALPKITHPASTVVTPTYAVDNRPYPMRVPTAPANNGVFWIGADGKVYVKGSQGTNAAGTADKNTATYWGNKGFSQIADPNTGASITPAPVGDGSGGGVVYPDMQGAIDILRQNISSLDPLYQTEVAKAIQAYDTSNNERLSAFNTNKATSDSKGIANDSTVLNSRNAINKNARMSSADIMSILGAMGVNGTGVGDALSVIANKSNTDTNAANLVYGQNKQNLLQSWNDYVNQDANQQRQLTDVKSNSIAQAGMNRATAKKTNLQDIAANMSASGNFNTSGILGELAGVNKDYNNLAGSVVPTYTGVTPTYAAPSISSILGPNQTAFNVTGGTTGTSGGVTPAKLVKVNPQSTAPNDKYGITN